MFIQELSPWLGEEAVNWARLLDGCVLRRWEKNEVLFHQGDEARFVYVVESGRICLTSFQPDGTEKQLFIAEHGAMFGEEFCLAGLPYLVSAVAIVDSRVCALPFSWLEQRMGRDTELNRRVLESLSRKNLVLLHQVMEYSSADAFQRIAQVLISLSRRYGETGPLGKRICIRFTHQDVANLIHVSRVTVSNVMNTFTRQGIVERIDGNFWVRKPELLAAIAQGSVRRSGIQQFDSDPLHAADT